MEINDEYIRLNYKTLHLDSVLKKYKVKDITILEQIMLDPHVSTPNLEILLWHQHLTFDFIKNYILNPDYQTNDREQNITIEEIKYYQIHLSTSEINELKGKMF